MKKIILSLLALMLIPALAFAAVGIKINHANIGQATDINFPVGTSYSYDGSEFTIPTLATSVSTITSGTISGITTFAFNGAAGAANSWQGVANGIEFEGATADAYETTLTVTDPTADRTITFPDATGTVVLKTATVALTPGAAVALTVGVGNQLYTDTPTDDQDQTITFSGAGVAGDQVTIIFTTVGTADEIITFHATLVSSTGTLTLSATAARYYVVRFVSNGSHWFEASRTAVQV